MSTNKTILWIILIGWMAGSAYWHVCKIKQLCDAPLVPTQTAVPEATAITTSLNIVDGTELHLTSSGNFRFAKSQATTNLAAVQPELDSLASFIIANPGKITTITGSYSPQETNNTPFPNLGIARATEVKNYLTGKGLSDFMFVLNEHPDNKIIFTQDSLHGGINFTFSNRAITTEKELADNEKYESIFKPIDLYFPKASAGYIKTIENQKFLLEAKKFLSVNKDKKLLLTGYSDNEDSAEWNLKLSKKRAGLVKYKLILLGVPADRIITDGKGEADPKASNATPEGRRANRRVSVVVQ